MDLTFRPMEVSDIPAVLSLRISTKENAITLAELEEDYGVTPSSLVQAMEADTRGWLCEVSGEVAGEAVGFAMGSRANGEVKVVAVRPGFEGHSIGQLLLACVRDWLFASGHDEIWLLSSPDPSIRAYGFYRHLGWRSTGERRGGDEVLVLRRPTTPSSPP